MTSKLLHTEAPHITYRMVLPKDFVCPDPEAGPDDMIQNPVLEECGHLLRAHFAGLPATHISTAGFVYYDRNDMNLRFEPDVKVAFGVDDAAIFRRAGYVTWEVGKPLDFVLEVASESTHSVDTGPKRALYARIGIREYWRFDPTGGELYGYPLAGDALNEGAYLPIQQTAEPDGMVWAYSPTLDLCLCVAGSRLLFYDRKTGSYLRNITEAIAERDEARAGRDEARAERDEAKAERDEAKAARAESDAARAESNAALDESNAALDESTAGWVAAEAETERLREQLRRLQG